MSHSEAGLISAELECPVVSLRDHQAPAPAVFGELFGSLANDGWQRVDFGLVRERRGELRSTCISTAQTMTTDTGPTLEIAPSPSVSLAGLHDQVAAITGEAAAGLERLGYALLGGAVHPAIRPVREEYLAYRTPRAAYDYVLAERGWHHWSIVDVASVQEVVDVSFDDAPRAVRMLHRLAGLMNFALRNDPDLWGCRGGGLSVRARAWRDHVPETARFPADRGRVGVPVQEVTSWRDYLSLLWEAAPMLLVGTKSNGAAWVPEHPSFLRFLTEAPAGGWPARTLAGEGVRIVPELEHVAKSDWTYMGFARIRWRWRETEDGLPRLLEAWRAGRIEDFLREQLVKVVIENRCNSAQPPGEALVSVALVAGLLANLDEAEAFALSEPYAFWLAALDASATEPMGTTLDGRSVPELLSRMLEVARAGLRLRGEPSPREALLPLERRIAERRSPAEETLCLYREGGVAALVRQARMCAGMPLASNTSGVLIPSGK
jgi:gamma-glutamylcysteine synthetase